MIERALNAIGEEKADLLRNLLVDEFGLLYPELITNEAMKTTYEEWVQQIRNINIGSWTSESYQERLKKLEQAENYCRYWVIFEEPTVSPKDYLVNGHRWLRVESPLIAGPRGGTRHCAIFDGALHYAESEVNLASVKRVDDWTPEVDKTENIPTFENAQPSDAQTVMQKTVNTKSSPLTLRETPGNNGQKILSIQKGETVTILKDGDWPLVEYNGHKGYVNGKYLK